MVADEIRALLLIHDRLNAWERPFIRDMAKLLEHRRSLTTKQHRGRSPNHRAGPAGRGCSAAPAAPPPHPHPHPGFGAISTAGSRPTGSHTAVSCGFPDGPGVPRRPAEARGRKAL